jgi:Kdo2-lipid IVA lauroyltransferase/acyltransferase
MKHRVRRTVLYSGLILLRLFVLCLPRPVYLALGRWVGRFVYCVLFHEREKTEKHLQIAFGTEKGAREISRIGQGVFENLGQNLAEWISFSKFNAQNIDSIVEVHGLEKIREVLKQGRGGVMLASHFGNWELIGPTVLMKMPEVDGTVIARRIYYDRYNHLLVRMRRSKRLSVLYRDDSPRKMLQVLKRNHLLGILPDQDTDGVEGEFINFFGKQAYTPTGPAAIARAAHTVLIPCFMVRQGTKHRLEIGDPIKVDEEKDKAQAIRDASEAWTKVLEGYIRRYPNQWVWMHRRWKTQK